MAWTGRTWKDASAATQTLAHRVAGGTDIQAVHPVLARASASLNPTISTSAYASGDVVGAAMTFSSLTWDSGSSFNIVNAILKDKSTQQAPLELWLFRNSPTLVNADNGAFDITDANLLTADLLGVIEFTTYYATSSNRVAIGTNRGQPLSAAPISGIAVAQAIYGAVAVRGTPTYGSTDLEWTLVVDSW